MNRYVGEHSRWCSVLVKHKSLYILFWSLQSENYIQLNWTENLWNIMSNLYCSCKQLLLIYPTDLFTSVIELTIPQHSVWQYRIVRRSNLLQDQCILRCAANKINTWVNNNKYMYFSNTRAPNVNFRKISVGMTIWDLKFSEHLLYNFLLACLS